MNSSLRFPALVVAALFSSCPQAHGAIFLDQSVDATRNGGIQIIADQIAGQTFTAGRSGLLGRIGVQLRRSTAVDDVTLTVSTAESDLPDTDLGSVVIPADRVPISGLAPHPYVDVDVTSLGIQVEADTQYAIYLSYEGQGIYYWPDTAPGPYSAGRSVVFTSRGVWAPILVDRDQGFRTFVAPEPAAAHMALFLATVLTLRRRSR